MQRQTKLQRLTRLVNGLLVSAWMGYGCNTLLPTLPDVTAGFSVAVQPDDKTVIFQSTSVSEAGILRESWDYGDGSNPEVKEGKSQVTHRYATPGNYIVTLTAVDKNYREAQSEQIVPVGLNRRPVALFTASPEAFSVPPSVTVKLNASASFDPEDGPIKYEWNFGDGSPPLDNANESETWLYTSNVVKDIRVGETKEIFVTLIVRDNQNQIGTQQKALAVTRAEDLR